MLKLAYTYQAMGQGRLALQTATEAAESARQAGDAKSVAAAAELTGVLHTLQGATAQAKQVLQSALIAAGELGEGAARASILNNLGNLRLVERRFDEAVDFYDQAATAARRADAKLIEPLALANKARALLMAGNREEAMTAAREAERKIKQLEASHEQASRLISVGRTLQEIGGEEALDAATGCYQEALAAAEKLKDERLRTYALGYLGEGAYAGGRRDEALRFTRMAIWSGSRTPLPDALMRWEWNLARLLRDEGDIDAALAAYRRAIEHLQGVRHDLMTAAGNEIRPESFREGFGGLFLERTDLLLKQAKTAPDANRGQALLREARDTMELLKNAELEDYLQDDCVNIALSRVSGIEQIAADTAVIYVIPLPDRTELLVGLQDGLERRESPVTQDELGKSATELRRKLEKRQTREYLPLAQTIHAAIIEPIRPLLESNQVKTLVFVPDGALRLIPPAALHDGEKFLVERFAVAISPGLRLMEPKRLQTIAMALLLTGVSDAVQGKSALPYVNDELDQIHRLFGGDLLLNRQFQKAKLESEFQGKPYSVVHMASHAEFGQNSRDPTSTYLLTYNDRLSLNDLERLIKPRKFRGQPVELLTLSACQTAAGDERAALGLAGVAFKAGARSALATLWSVNDQSSATLVTEFYKQLELESASKARALQLAQLQFISDPRYGHPYYWSPYLLIGNWL